MFKFCSPKQAQSFQLGKVITLLMVTTYFFPIITFANRQFEESKSFKSAITNSETVNLSDSYPRATSTM
jgi:hypothetical protein